MSLPDYFFERVTADIRQQMDGVLALAEQLGRGRLTPDAAACVDGVADAAAGVRRMLDCAADLFSKYGYARATTAQLAKAAGVTEPIIYRHFDSKRDLFVALIERTGRETITQWEQHLAGAEDRRRPPQRTAGAPAPGPTHRPDPVTG